MSNDFKEFNDLMENETLTSNNETIDIPEQNQDQTNQTDIFMDNSNENNSRSLSSTVVHLTSILKKMPGSVRTAILASIPYVLIGIFILFGIVFLQAIASAVSEDFFEVFNDNDKLGDLKEELGNFFTGNGFVTDEEEAAIAETKYFEKLEEVYRYYQQKYAVEIDTTLITATLFFDHGMSDYIEDDSLNGIEDSGDSIDANGDAVDENIFQDTANFYKVARRHIRTLAKYQIVENTSYNTCTDTPQTKITPESDKEVADTWVAFYGWNQRATFNYQKFNSVSYPQIDGTPRSITWCEYKEAEPQLRQAYQDDYNIYIPYEKAYNSCFATCSTQRSCRYDENLKKQVCSPSCNPDTACANEKAEMEKYKARLDANWSDIFNTSNGSFQCRYSNTWGALSSYVGPGFHNYNFDPDWINRDKEPNFWEQFMASLTSPIGCSAKPAITYRYTTSIEREGVYYYKLLSRNAKFLSNKNFIERYYPDQVDLNDADQAMEDAIEIVENIFDVYEYVVGQRPIRSSSSSLCMNGVTVTGKGAGIYDLESYVAGVVANENTLHVGDNIENMKAQAVAARTYVLNKTQNCTVPIQNSTSAQTFNTNPDKYSIRAAEETAGEILVDASGNPISAQYDAWAEKGCDSQSCTLYQKDLKIPLDWVNGHLSQSQREFFSKHYHGNGMSQYGSFYLSTAQNYDYRQILSFFYSGSSLTVAVGSDAGEDGTYFEGGRPTYPDASYSGFDGTKLVYWARQYIGNKYVFGGNSLTNGIDCSGFTQQLMKNLFNISIPRTAYLQSTVGVPVASIDQAQPGDLLFFNNGSGRAPIDHVSIYSGNGKNVHAANSKVGIVESNVNTKKLVAIRRLQ